MKTILVILTQPNLSSLQVHESLSATMVLATFGCEVKVLLQDGALSLLASELEFNQLQNAFRLASNMIDSFEFYDLTPVLIDEKDKNHPFVRSAEQEIEFTVLDASLIQQFDHVLYW